MSDPSPEGTARISLKGEELLLSPERVVYWPAHQMLIVSDLHLGKAGHFRKHGIAVPASVHHHDLYTLTMVKNQFGARHIVFLGDLFHSEPNAQWRQLEDWVTNYGQERMTLVRGNHDILPDRLYEDLGMEVVDELHVGPFHFTHEEELKEATYNISGHLHPGVRLRGLAKQGLRIPCFYFRPENAYMPAFGKFTGLYTLRKRKQDKAFGIAENQVFSV